MFYRDVTDEQFLQLVWKLKPGGVLVLVFHKRDNMRHLKTKGQEGFYIRPRSGPSMDRVFLGAGGPRSVNSSDLFRTTRICTTVCNAHAPGSPACPT